MFGKVRILKKKKKNGKGYSCFEQQTLLISLDLNMSTQNCSIQHLMLLHISSKA